MSAKHYLSYLTHVIGGKRQLQKNISLSQTTLRLGLRLELGFGSKYKAYP